MQEFTEQLETLRALVHPCETQTNHPQKTYEEGWNEAISALVQLLEKQIDDTLKEMEIYDSHRHDFYNEDPF